MEQENITSIVDDPEPTVSNKHKSNFSLPTNLKEMPLLP